MDDFYRCIPKNKEMEGEFTDELKILSRKMKNICQEWKADVKEALKTHPTEKLYDPYLSVIVHNYLKMCANYDVNTVLCQIYFSI